MAADRLALRLFVYGTLKRGGRYHDRYCGGASAIERATVRGRLYTMPAGYPVLVVPSESILAHGSRDALADVRLQAQVVPTVTIADGEDWQEIAGELQTFVDPPERLAALDALEDFHPDAASLYRRVLLAVRRENGASVTAWAYVEGTRNRPPSAGR